jgi:hypothetical protein
LAEINVEFLMLLPESANDFRSTRTTVGVRRSLHGARLWDSISSQSLSTCVRLSLKDVGKHMPEAEIRELLQTLNVNVQAVMQLLSKWRDQNLEKPVPWHHTSLLCQWRKALMWWRCVPSPISVDSV